MKRIKLIIAYICHLEFPLFLFSFLKHVTAQVIELSLQKLHLSSRILLILYYY